MEFEEKRDIVFSKSTCAIEALQVWIDFLSFVETKEIKKKTLFAL